MTKSLGGDNLFSKSIHYVSISNDDKSSSGSSGNNSHDVKVCHGVVFIVALSYPKLNSMPIDLNPKENVQLS